MSHPCNAGCRTVATCLVWAAGVVVSAGGARGQAGDLAGGQDGRRPVNAESAPAAPAALSAEPPSPAACLSAFHAMEKWVRAWSVPAEAQAVDPEGTAGVCVTLRLAGVSGRVLTRSVVMASGSNKGRTLWEAARRALAEADPKMPVEKDATRGEQLREVAARVLIDVQFAGAGVPLDAASYDEAARRFSPGREGVLARVRGENDEMVSAVFPGQQLSMALGAARAVEVAVGGLKLPPVALSELRDKHGMSLQKFAVRHVAQESAGDAPVILFRGSSLVPLAAMSSEGMREFAGAMADHLQSHVWRGAEAFGLRGSYNPLTDVYSPPVAGAREQAVAALALLEFARFGGASPERARSAAGAAAKIVDDLTVVVPPETDPATKPVDAAAWLIADAELSNAGTMVAADGAREQRTVAFRARALAGVRAAFTPPDAWGEGLTPGERAMVALALAVTAGDEAARDTAKSAVRSLFRSTEPGQLVALMPWLGRAEVALVNETEAVPSAEALRQLRTLCWGAQLAAGAVPDDPDFAGGIAFAGGGAGGPALPTWQTLRPLAWMAEMLGDPRLTSKEEVRDEVLRLLNGLRFARQLAVDPSVSHMFRDHGRARGGIRLSLWDQTVSVDATSMGLIAVSRALRSADLRSK